MTVQGNGSNTLFDFPFTIPDATYVSVLYTDTDGTQTLLTTSQYTVALNAPAEGQLWSVGGTVTYPVSGSAIANGTSLTIFRNLPLLQDVTIRNQGNFYPEVTEEALDLQCMETQQVSARTGRILGDWATGVDYLFSDIVQDGINGNDTQNFYTCIQGNTSNVWQDDLEAGYWSLSLNIQQVSTYADDAAASAAAAATSASNASSSATSASTSAANALTSANTASASASSATNSASSATTSAATATTQAGNASTSASSASSSASAASASATTASTAATNASNSASAAATSAGAGATSAAAAAASASQAVGTLLGTSTTSNSVGLGAKTFTTQADLALGAGGFVTIASTVTPANYLHGQVTSYTGTTLIVDSLDVGGTGTFTDWTITTSSPQGPPGAGAGTVNSGTASQIAYYAGTGDAVSGNANLTIATGALRLGQAASVQGSLLLSGSSSGTTTIAAGTSGGGTMTLQAGSDTLVGRATTDTLTNKTLSASSNVLGGVTMTLSSDAQGDIYYRSSGGVLTRLANGGANTLLHGSGTVPAYSAVVEADLSLTDVTTANSSSTKHGFAPKSSADATLFLNGAATPAYAAVKDSDLSLTDITTNNSSTSKHGFCPKLSNTATQFLNGTGGWTTPTSGQQPQMTVFTADGTFTTSANITTSTVFKFTIVGGGGGGGRATNTGFGGAGGGAGSTAIYVVAGLSPSTGYAITVGTAGAGASTSTNPGGNGGASSVTFGANPSAGGGTGGTSDGAGAIKVGGAGGTATSGTINISGGPGTNNFFVATSTFYGGNGGCSSMGGGGLGAIGGVAGVAGQAYGSGGSGGAANSATGRNGGAGKAGIVIVEWLE